MTMIEWLDVITYALLHALIWIFVGLISAGIVWGILGLGHDDGE